MNCQDVHEGFSSLLDGDIGLTERVPLEAHLRKCADCRQELENLQKKKGGARPITWRPRLRRSVIPRIPDKLLAVAASVTLVAVLVLVVLERLGQLALPLGVELIVDEGVQELPEVFGVHADPISSKRVPLVQSARNRRTLPSALLTALSDILRARAICWRDQTCS